MSDQIKREDAMGAVQDHFNANGFKGYDDGQKMMDRIKALPSAEAVQGWIPVGERLPSDEGCYLVCMSWEYNNMDVLTWADGWNCYRGYDGKICKESEIDGADILAWMYLPEPYKGGDTE